MSDQNKPNDLPLQEQQDTDEADVGGHGFRWGTTEEQGEPHDEDKSQDKEKESEVGGHGFRWGATEEGAQDDDPEVQGHGFRWGMTNDDDEENKT